MQLLFGGFLLADGKEKLTPTRLHSKRDVGETGQVKLRKGGKEQDEKHFESE